MLNSTELPSQNCDECGRQMHTAHRIEGGVRYCAVCYQRCFKRKVCPRCGTFSRLLAKDPLAICKTCTAAQPCIRCERAGRPLSLLLPQGPVCNACYPYFRKPKTCSVCHRETRRYSNLKAPDAGIICDSCAAPPLKTCSVCRRHRICLTGTDGAPMCTRCAQGVATSCVTCSASIAPGRNGHCESCYWRDRTFRRAGQIREMYRKAEVRDALTEYVVWALETVEPKRLCLSLNRHADFFAELDKDSDVDWSPEFLLRRLGPAILRKYELPARWVQIRGSFSLSPEDKVDSAELRRVSQMLLAVPSGTLASQLLQEFFAELQVKVSQGDLKLRSARMAMRPAVSLLYHSSQTWQSMPDQSALNKLLHDSPGQKAACSTFLGFLRRNHGLNLIVSPTLHRTKNDARRRLGEYLAKVGTSAQRDASFDREWQLTCLRYFHHLSKLQAVSILKDSAKSSVRDGQEITKDGKTWWIPSPPNARKTLSSP